MFHVFKQTRCYEGQPYSGYSSGNVPQEFKTVEEARRAVNRLQTFNPVGWNIFDAETGKLVEGKDLFSENE